MKKVTTILSYLLFFSLLVGCEKGDGLHTILSPYFVSSEIVVEVTEETKSFRIEMGWPVEHPDITYFINKNVNVYLDKEATTAKHNTHFINTPAQELGGTIGKFEVLLEERKAYKDVTIIPKNITEQVIITYSTTNGRPEGLPIEGEGGLFNQLTVILKPKPSK